MRTASEILRSALEQALVTLQGVARHDSQIAQAADLITDCFRQGKKLLVCGNGGSAADAADFCTEFACRFDKDRRPYPAMNLAQGGSLITATGNDYGFDEIFARQVRAFGISGDLLIAVSTSGNSKNIQRALEEGKSKGLRTIAVLGRDGGSSKNIADIDILVTGTSTARIQEAHKFVLHVLCEVCEARLAKN
jgi:D-sedoheptulose 7-phosphate isomerase